MVTNKNLEDATAQDAKPTRVWRLVRYALNVLRVYFGRLLRVSEDQKPKIYASVFQNCEIADLNYWLEILFSIGIATLGLIINSPAVVIGAMLISPLMGPIIGSGLAIALGDFYLGFKAFLNVLLSTVASILLAALITWLLPFRTPTPEILARVQPTLLDLWVAVLSGMAGAIVVCRGGRGGGVTALPGVAVAVALMPPLGVTGFGIGSGMNWAIIRGGGLLFVTNLVAIIFSSFLVFFSIRMDSLPVREKIGEWLEEHTSSEKFYASLRRTPLRAVLGHVGTLPRRLLILVVFLGSVSWPLGQTLSRLRDEAQIRHVVSNALDDYIPRQAIVREDLEINRKLVSVRVVAVLPGGFPLEKQNELEKSLSRQTERQVQLLVYDVATRSELASLARPAPAPEVVSFDELRANLLARVRPALESVWPTASAPLLEARLTLDPDSPAVLLHLVYLSDDGLGPLGEQALVRDLRQRVGSAQVNVEYTQVRAQWNVAFRRGTVVLSPEARGQLDALASALQNYPRLQCRVALPQRSKGKPEPLAQRHALAIQTYLTGKKKVAAERIRTEPATAATNSLVLKLILPPS